MNALVDVFVVYSCEVMWNGLQFVRRKLLDTSLSHRLAIKLIHLQIIILKLCWTKQQKQGESFDARVPLTNTEHICWNTTKNETNNNIKYFSCFVCCVCALLKRCLLSAGCQPSNRPRHS